MFTKVTIPYGHTELSFELPSKNLIKIGSPRDVKCNDVKSLVDYALNNPIGTGLLNQLISKGQKVAIISDDYTRPTPVKDVMPSLIKQLNESGISDDDIVIVVAAGIHREMTSDELTEKLGSNIVKQFRIVQHRSEDESTLEYLGETKAGTPVWINKDVVAADFRIGIGMVEAHPYAGFSGGPKIMMPGVAGQKTIFRHHGFLARSAQSWFGSTQGNPFWEDLKEVAEIGKLNFVVNTVLNGNYEIIKAFSGEPVKTQEKAIEEFINVYGMELKEPVDVVIASANPKHWYFDQSLISILNASNIIKDGGSRIIASYCSENLGPGIIRQLYWESFAREWPSPEEYLQEIVDGRYDYEMADAPIIYKFFQAANKSDITLVSCGINPEEIREMRVDWTNDINIAIEKAFAKNGPDATVAVLPYGGMSYPHISPK